RVDFGGQGGGVADFKSYMALPFGLERCDIDDDAAARVGGFANADRQDVPRDAEVLDRPPERERVRRDDAHFALELDKGARIEMLGIHNGRVDVGEDAELIGHANIVTVRRQAEADNAIAHLAVRKRLDYPRLDSPLADPAVRSYHARHL